MPPLEVQREVKGQQLFGPAAKARSGWLTPMGPLHQFPWKIGHWAQMVWGHVANEMLKVHVETLATYLCGTQIRQVQKCEMRKYQKSTRNWPRSGVISHARRWLFEKLTHYLVYLLDMDGS